MSTADEPGRPQRTDRTPDPRRARLLIAAVVLGAVVLVITFMLLVSQCGPGKDSEIYGAVPVPSGTSAVQ